MSDVKVRGIEFDFQGNAKNISNSLDNVKTKMQETSSASSDFSKRIENAFSDRATEQAKKLSTTMSNVSTEIKKSGSEIVKTNAEIQKSVAKTTASFDKRSLNNPNASWKTAENMQLRALFAEKGRNVSNKDIAKVEDNLKKQGIEPQQIAKANEKLKEMSDESEKVKVKASDINKNWKALTKIIKVPFDLGIKGAKGLGMAVRAGVTQATSGIRRVMSAFETLRKRIASVLLRRIITSVLRTIWSSMQEGIQNMYAFSQSARASFVSAMDSMATSALYLKNSLGAALAPALEALAPVIDFIIDKFVALLNIINQVISFITGKSFWTKAIKQAQSFGGATGGGASKGLDKVADSAKEAKKEVDLFLASFDELHLTNKPEEDALDASTPNGGSGGGGGGGGLDTSTMFENVDFDSDLKELLEKGDWFGIGELFASKLNVLTQSADTWILETFTPWATTFGTNLGNLINGFVAEYDWSLLGQTVGHGMNAIIGGANAFLTTTDFSALGSAIGTTIKSWFDTVDWDGDNGVGAYFANKFNAVIHFFEGAVTTIFGGKNAENIGKKLSGAIKKWIEVVDWVGLATAIKTGFNGAITTFSTMVNDQEMWNKLKEASNTLFGALAEIDVATLANDLGTAFTNAMGLVDWNTIGTKIGEFMGNLPWGDITLTILNAGWELIKGAFSGFFGGKNGAELAAIIATGIGAKLALQNLTVKITPQLAQGAVSKVASNGLTAVASLLGVPSSVLSLVGGGTIGLLIYAYVNYKKGQNFLTNNGEFSNPTEKFKSDANSWADVFGFDINEPIEIPTKTKDPTKASVTSTLNNTQSMIEKGKEIGKALLVNKAITSVISSALGLTATDVKNNSTKLEKPVSVIKAAASAITSALKGTSTDVSNNTTKLNKPINPIKAVMKTVTDALGLTATDVTNNATTLKKNILPIKSTSANVKTALTETRDAVSGHSIQLKKTLITNPSTTSQVKTALTDTQSTITNGRALTKGLGITLPSGSSVVNDMQYQLNIGGGLSKGVGLWYDYGNPQAELDKSTLVKYARIEYIDTQNDYGWNNDGTNKNRKWASGGFVREGQMFIAREAGPELVGQIGTRTAVANNEQIVASVARGVAGAVSGVLGNLNNGGNQNLTVYLDGEVVYNNVVQRNNSHVARTGNSELLV